MEISNPKLWWTAEDLINKNNLYSYQYHKDDEAVDIVEKKIGL